MAFNTCLYNSILSVIPSFKSASFLKNISSVQFDSRQVVPGSVFFALPGSKTDGHSYIEDAIQKGAIGIVSSKKYEKTESLKNVAFAEVPDVLEALQKSAKAKIQRNQPKIIAITGSVGKTTTKEFVKTLCQSEKKVFSPSGNLNSQIGLPCAILNEAEDDVEWYILEMGMTHKGNIKKLVEIAPPDISAVISIHYAHSENFSDLQEIAEAKAEIFSQAQNRLINLDAQYASDLIESHQTPYKTFSISRKQGADFQLDRKEGKIICYEGDICHTISDPMFPADHNYDNLLAAMSIAREAGISWYGIEKAVLQLTLPKQRLEFTSIRGIDFINDSYNASEPSMISALKVLERMKTEKKKKRAIAVLGQMRELGKFSKECHERVGEYAAHASDMIFCLGEEAKPIYEICMRYGKKCIWTTSFSELFDFIQSTLQVEDIVLLKGSRSNQLWRVLEQYSAL